MCILLYQILISHFFSFFSFFFRVGAQVNVHFFQSAVKKKETEANINLFVSWF